MNSESAAPGEPFFSVVIPAFNAARYVREALASVQEQTFESFECIVVDDGSTDATPAIVSSFENDSRFRSIGVAHGGTPGRARNYGIQAASGRYVAFLDADDAWTPDKLKRCYEHIVETGAALVFSNCHTIDEAGRKTSLVLSRRMKRQLGIGDPFLLISNVVPLGSVAVRRSLFGEVGFSEDPEYKAVEDYDLWLKLNARHSFDFIVDPLLLYRCHPEQIHHNYLDQLRKWELVLEDPAVIETYGGGAVDLARALVDVRRQYTEKGLLAGLRRAFGMIRWLGTPQRHVLLYYVRFGLLQRVSTRVRQGMKGSMVGT